MYSPSGMHQHLCTRDQYAVPRGKELLQETAYTFASILAEISSANV